jgi:hypothetical protein
MTDPPEKTATSNARYPSANRAYHPRGYDLWWKQGRDAAEAGKPRETPFGFVYNYASSCWFDGYDDIRFEQ